MPTRTVHVAVYDTLADWEVGHATAHLANGMCHREPGGFRVAYVGATTEPVTTMGGLRVLPDLTLDQLEPADGALLILPGAATWDTGELAAFGRKAEQFTAAGVPVAAICGATYGLAANGLLDDRPHTSNAAEYLAMSGYAGGAHYVDAPAVTGGTVITANSTAPVDFAREIFRALDVYEDHVLDGWYRLFAHGDPAGYAVLAEYETRQSVR
ncbi:type 1 glutamine amidotransferase family protein [Nocardia thailandica]